MQFEFHDLSADAARAADAVRLVRRLFTCDYAHLDEYLQVASKSTEMLQRNTAVWTSCQRTRKDLCFDVAYLRAVCDLFPVHVMKTVRLPLSAVAQLMADPELQDLQVVYLVRDPRGTISSRRRMKWCRNVEVCSSAAVLCRQQRANHDEAVALLAKYPHRFTVLRYEDLSVEPMDGAKALLARLGLPWVPEVEKFVDDHTKKNVDEPWSTTRTKGSRIAAWKSDLSADDVQSIQEVCQQTLDDFGYRLVPRDNFKDAETVDSLPVALRQP